MTVWVVLPVVGSIASSRYPWVILPVVGSIASPIPRLRSLIPRLLEPGYGATVLPLLHYICVVGCLSVSHSLLFSPPSKTGGELVSAEHYHSEEVRDIVQTLSQSWKELSSASNEKGPCQLYTILVFK